MSQPLFFRRTQFLTRYPQNWCNNGLVDLEGLPKNQLSPVTSLDPASLSEIEADWSASGWPCFHTDLSSKVTADQLPGEEQGWEVGPPGAKWAQKETLI